MSFDFVKFERGQVWMVRFKNQESLGREQAKDRPWLVLSVGKFNQSAGMITCVPITSRDHIVTPAQVLFTNQVGKRNVILCEQIRTFDYRSGAYIFDFMGNLSDKVLESVDVALSIHLGLHYSPISLKSLYDSIEAIVKSVTNLKEDSPKFTDSDVVNFAQKLKSLALDYTAEESNYLQGEESIEILDYKENSEHSNEEINTSENIPVEKEIIHVPMKEKRKRISWTPALCREYLSDLEKLPMKEVMRKWEIEKKTRVYSMKHYVQTLIEKE